MSERDEALKKRSPEYLAFQERLFRTAYETIENATIPLCQRNEKNELCMRSGLLIEIGGATFLVSAAHDVFENRIQGRHLQVILPTSGTLPLVYEKFFKTINNEEDLLFIRLEESTLKAMGDSFKTVRVQDMLSRHIAKDIVGRFLILGFPYAMNRVDAKGIPYVETWRYVSWPYQGDYTGVENYDPETHLILTYQLDTWNREGELVYPPGLSGCGVWFIAVDIDQPLTRESFKLVAIQNAWRECYEYAKATWIDVLLTAIWKNFPEMQAPLKENGFKWP